MIAVAHFQGRPVGVLGLARSGVAAARALAAGGAKVLAWDDDPARRETAAATGDVDLHDLAEADWRGIPALVISPGIPQRFPQPHPAATRARAAGAEIIGDIELLGRARPQARYIGITGTNGKSTTTALIGHVLRESGHRAETGGNLGTPALTLAALESGGSYVLELSSYQLELITTLRFDIAVLLNITPDHLDRHGGMDGYIAAKRRIFDRQTGACSAVIGVDDAICRDICDELRREGGRRVVPVSVERPVEGGVYVAAGQLVDAIDGRPTAVLDLADAPHLPGAHNHQNAAAAYAVARRVGVAPETAAAMIRSFPGLAHRQELVGTIGGVPFVNDSKATNADAADKALACYRAIYWIAGGVPKAGGIVSLAPHFGRVRHAFLIGQATEEFAATLEGKIPVTRCGDLAGAVAAAAQLAEGEHPPGAVVLLSPACASFDQFTDFEARGEAFRALVAGLRTGSAKGGVSS